MSTNDVSRAAVQHTFDLILAGGDLLEFAATDPVVASMRLVELDEVLRLLGEYVEREMAEKRAIEMLMIQRSWELEDAAEGQNG